VCGIAGRRFVKRLLVVVLAVLLVVTIQPSLRASAAALSPLAAAQTIADQRATDVLHDNRQDFLNTIDPEAPQSFRDAQAKLFDGLHSLPLSKYQVMVTETNSGDLAPGLRLSSKHKADVAFLPETRVTYRLGNYDDRDAIDSYWYTYVERAGKWYIASDDDASMLGIDSAAELWDEGALSVQSNPHVLVLTDADNAGRGAQLLSTATNALNTFDQRWTTPWNDKIVVIDPGSVTEASRLIKNQGNIADFSAFTVFTPITTNGWTTTAPRVFAQDANLNRESVDLQTDTFVHELTHYVESAMSGPFMPTWAHEGTAEWMRLGKPASVNPVVANPTLPAPADFSAGTPSQIGQAYRSAASAMAFVSSLKGPNGPVDLFQAIGSRRNNIGSPAYNIDQAMQQDLGMTTAQFTAAWDAQFSHPSSANSTDSAGG
jgi:hypothetical protein